MTNEKNFEFVESSIDDEKIEPTIVYHLGACSNTAETDSDFLMHNNTLYSRDLIEYCIANSVRIIYASSAATYGLGEFGYDDNETNINQLLPLNPYGESKNEFDKWALAQNQQPYFWAGLKFFNVYGPNEYHKARMASVVFHAYQQIKNTGSLNLFKSHHPDFKDGEQMRDFVYVKDVVNVLYFFLHHRKDAGIYNLGSGKARTFKDLAAATFQAMAIAPQINFIDTPADIRDKYQYFTEAKMQKLKAIGYEIPFHTIEQGVADYVNNYLAKNNYL